MLKDKVPWKTIGITGIYTAENGINALKIIDEVIPSVVISDIKMDGMDGIELLKEVRTKYPEIKLILLSAYDDFSYAQAGIKNGAADYLLKPIDEEALLATVKNTLKEIEREENNKKIISRVDELFKQGTRFLYEALLRNLINGNRQEIDTIKAYLNFKDDTFSCERYRLVIVQYNSDGEEGQTGSRKLKEYRSLIKGEFAAWLDDRGIVIDLLVAEDLIFLIGLFNGNELAEIDSLYASISRNLPLSVSFVCSSWFADLCDTEQMYHRSEIAFNNYFYREECPEICFCDHNDDGYEDTFFPFEQEEQFRNALLISDAAVAGAIIEEAFHWFLLNEVNPDNLKKFTIRILRIFVEVLRQCKIGAEEINEVEVYNENKVWHFRNYLELKEWLLEKLDYTIQLLQKKKESKKRKLIEDIVSFIETHYAENLSLESISERFMLNPAYLSRLFKNNMGKNFSQFLTETRINKAKELLRDPCMLIYMISDKVGYNNEKYFYKIFKEIEGITPSQYRDKVIR
jgi:two-component system response regulator YesN